MEGDETMNFPLTVKLSVQGRECASALLQNKGDFNYWTEHFLTPSVLVRFCPEAKWHGSVQLELRNAGAALIASYPYSRLWCNHYRCVHCDVGWTDYWSCQCDTECPVCSVAISPHESDCAVKLPDWDSKVKDAVNALCRMFRMERVVGVVGKGKTYYYAVAYRGRCGVTESYWQDDTNNKADNLMIGPHEVDPKSILDISSVLLSPQECLIRYGNNEILQLRFYEPVDASHLI